MDQKFNVAKYFKDYDGNLPVPSLEEVCNTLGEGVEIHLEIKNRDNIYPDIHRKIAEFIERRKTFSQSFLVSSFHHETLKKIKNLDTGISIGALFRRGEVKDAVKTALSLKAASINIHFSDAGKKLVNEAHKKGLKVLAYTVNDKKTAKRMKLLGIDGIFTDQTDLISIKK